MSFFYTVSFISAGLHGNSCISATLILLMALYSCPCCRLVLKIFFLSSTELFCCLLNRKHFPLSFLCFNLMHPFLFEQNISFLQFHFYLPNCFLLPTVLRASQRLTCRASVSFWWRSFSSSIQDVFNKADL